MATHDYIIDNGTGAAVRADLNNALAAIVSNNSNSSAPSTTYAYQFWADTGNNVLKIRNSANDAFIELFQLDGTLTLEDGSASTPALAFRDDLNTGIYSSAANKFNVATDGVERMELGTTTIFNEDGADVDFRIEGNTDTNLFKCDAGADRIGIGSNIPLAKLDIARLGASWTGSDPVSGTALHMHNGNNASTSPVYLGLGAGSASISGINFGDENDADVGRIHYSHSDNSIRFGTNGSSERIRIDTDGNMGINASTVQAKLHIKSTLSDTNALVKLESFHPKIRFQDTSATSKSGEIKQDGDALRFNISVPVDDATDLSEIMRVTSDGDVLIGTTSKSTTHSYFEASSSDRVILNLGCSSTAGSNVAEFKNPNGTVGNIQVSGSSTAFNTSSDYRLKENATAISDGITRLKTLKPYRFNFKADATTIVDGFFAHEVTAVPEAITGTKDQVDSDNNPVYQGIDQSKLVPLLVAAVQELITKVETLESA